MAEDGILSFKFRTAEDTQRDTTLSREIADMTEELMFSTAYDPLGEDGGDSRGDLAETAPAAEAYDLYEPVDSFEFMF